MLFKDWKRDILTIPNLLSLFRLALIPVYVCLYLRAQEPFQYYLSGGILAISCLTDALDGKIARHFHMISRLGIVLDPLADKITQFAMTLCLSLRYPVLNPVMILFSVKELFQLTLGAVNLSRGKMLPGALMSGKICTAVLFLSFIILVLFPNISGTAVTMIALTDSLFLTIAFIHYFFAYFGKSPKLQDLD